MSILLAGSVRLRFNGNPHYRSRISSQMRAKRKDKFFSRLLLRLL